MRLSDIEGYAKLKFRVKEKKGAIVTKVFKGGLGERFGLRLGDVILRINNADAEDKASFESLMAEGLRRNYILYQIRRKGELLFIPIKLDSLL